MQVLHVIARDELDPPAAIALAVDPEDASIQRPLDAVARDAYQRRFAEWRDDVARSWRLAGATYRAVLAEGDAALEARAVATAAAGRA